MSKEKKKRSLFGRLLRLLLILVLLVIVGLTVVYFMRNSLITATLEKTLGTANGAQVNVDGLNLDLFNSKLTWDKVQIADPKNTMRNVAQLGSAEFDIDLWELVDGNYIFETCRLQGITFNNKRQTDGKLAKTDRVKVVSGFTSDLRKQLEQFKSEIPAFDPNKLKTSIDTDEIVKMLNLKTPAKADSLRKLVETRWKVWDDRIKNNTYEKDFKRLMAEARSLDPKNIKTPQDVERAINAIDTIFNTSEKLIRQAKKDKVELEKDLATLKALKKDIPAWIEADYNQALRLANLPSAEVGKIAEMLFGPTIADYLGQTLAAMETAQNALPPQPQNTTPPVKPKFWLKKLVLSGDGEKGLQITGTVNDICSHPDLINKPMVFKLTVVSANNYTATLSGTMDQRQGKQVTSLKLSVDDVNLKGTAISSFALLPRKIERGQASITASLVLAAGTFDADIDFNAKNVRFAYKEPPKNMDKNLVRITRRLADSITTLTLNANVTNKGGKTNYKFRSNVDKLVAKELKSIMSEEVEKAKKRLYAYVQKQLGDQTGQLEKFIDAKNGDLFGRLQVLLSDGEALDKFIKEQKKTIEKSLTKQAGKEIEKGLKGLMKGIKF